MFSGIVAFQMLQQARSNVLCLANINPKGAEETVNPGRLRCVQQDRFTLEQELAVTVFGERRVGFGRLVNAIGICSRFECELRRAHFDHPPKCCFANVTKICVDSENVWTMLDQGRIEKTIWQPMEARVWQVEGWLPDGLEKSP